MENKQSDINVKDIEAFGLVNGGMTAEKAGELIGISGRAVYYRLAKVRGLLKQEIPDSPIVNQRKRLTAILPDTGAVYEKIVKRVANTNEYSDKDAELALKASDTINKGLQVLITKTEAPAPTTYEDKRIQVIERLNIASQFGGHVPAAIQAQAETITDTEPTPPVPEADQTVEDDDNTPS